MRTVSMHAAMQNQQMQCISVGISRCHSDEDCQIAHDCSDELQSIAEMQEGASDDETSSSEEEW